VVHDGKDPAESRIDETLEKSSKEAPVSVDTKPKKPVYTESSCSVDYFGDAFVLLKDMASGVGYTASTSGPQPNLPIYVSVHVTNKPMKDVLAQIADQLGARADIVVRNKELVLKYRDN